MGTALGQTGIILYVGDNDEAVPSAPDTFDNSGYVANLANCGPTLAPAPLVTSGDVVVK